MPSLLRPRRTFRKEITNNPTFALAYLYLGATLRRFGRNNEALPILKEAVLRDPNYVLAYNELATAQKEAGNTEEASLRTFKRESADSRKRRRSPRNWPAFTGAWAGPRKRKAKRKKPRGSAAKTIPSTTEPRPSPDLSPANEKQ